MRKPSSSDAVELMKSKGPIVFLAIVVILSVYVIAKHRDETTFPDAATFEEMMEFQKSIETHGVKERIKERDVGVVEIQSGELGLALIGKDGKAGNLEFQKTGCRKGKWKVVAISKTIFMANEPNHQAQAGSEEENASLSFLAYHDSLPQPATDGPGWQAEEHEFSNASTFFLKDAIAGSAETPPVKLSVKQSSEPFAQVLRQRETGEVIALLLEF
jgi:hypothetical protein